MIIYNIFPLLTGNVGDWKPHLARAADMGFDWVFVNPVQAPGASGSLYSIRDYFRLNPLFVDGAGPNEALAEFKSMVAQAEELGLKIMVDLVVSHCAYDSPLTREHPEWFLHEKGRVAHPFCMEDKKKVVWKDLAQFDHKRSKDKEGLFKYLVKVAGFLADLGVKGFRCDAAYQLPEAFWRRFIQTVRKQYPSTVFLAETLGCKPAETVRTAGAGFAYVFNSSKWWDFEKHWLMEQYNVTREHSRSVSFPESHDTVRLAEECHGNVDALKQRYFFSAFFSAGVMIPIGFEFGFRKRLHVVNTRPKDWEEPQTDLRAFIKNVNRAKAQNPVFLEDAPTEVLFTDNPAILFLWKGSLRAEQDALIILNKDPHNKQHFQTRDLYQYLQSPGPLFDVSPEYPLEYLPTPYDYTLRPGQGIVLVTRPSAERKSRALSRGGTRLVEL